MIFSSRGQFTFPRGQAAGIDRLRGFEERSSLSTAGQEEYSYGRAKRQIVYGPFPGGREPESGCLAGVVSEPLPVAAGVDVGHVAVSFVQKLVKAKL
jgi:hypothetical protein